MKTKKYLQGLMLAAMLAFHGTAQADTVCDFGTPHPDMPEQFGQYGFIIGDFEVRIRLWLGEKWSEQYQKARWTGRYILGGRAIMDEWFPFDPDDKPGAPGGVNIRMYDPEEGWWKLMWMGSAQLVPTELRSQVKEEGKMHLWRVYPTPDTRKIVFETYDQDNWARFDYVRDEKGEKWIGKFKFEAHRRPCG